MLDQEIRYVLYGLKLDEDCYRARGQNRKPIHSEVVFLLSFPVRVSAVKIEKILNNNILIASNDAGRDLVIMGRGVGFGARRGDSVDSSRIERIFVQSSGDFSRHLTEMVREIPEEYFDVVREIVTHAKLRLDVDLGDNVYLALVDHVCFSVTRWREGISIPNGMLLETQMVYPDEFSAAMEARDYINDRFGVKLPEDEAAFIALHFVNAETDSTANQTVEITKIVQQAVSLMCERFSVKVGTSELDDYRLMLHLKLFATRVVKGSPHSDDRVGDQLIELVRTSYPEAYKCASDIASWVERTHGRKVTDHERMYLAVHIRRVIDSKSGPG